MYLCPTCNNYTIKLQKLRSLQEDKREDLLKKSLLHLDIVAKQREHYKRSIIIWNVVQHFLKTANLECCKASSIVQHYSFDFAQQISLPNSRQQVGPIYLLVPYKLAIFGIMCEPVGKMVIYVIPESVLANKGSKMVISLLHHFLSKCAVGEKK